MENLFLLEKWRLDILLLCFIFVRSQKTNRIVKESSAVLFIDEFYFEQCGYLIYSGEL